MARTTQLVQWGRARLTRRLVRAAPWIGAAIALATIATTMKRKGVVRGAVDMGLDALPLVGTLKNVAEAIRGRDFIPDRTRYGPAPRRST